VFVGGVTVTNATLHNEDEARRKDVRLGDTVIVRRAGDVIPEVVAVLPDKRPEGCPEFTMPRQCPVCASAAVREEGEATTAAPGACSAALSASKRSCILPSAARLRLKGLGDKLVDQLWTATTSAPCLICTGWA
jgi:DNA ligase (NAD+)